MFRDNLKFYKRYIFRVYLNMIFVTENFLLAISIFFIGTLLSIIISKLSKTFFKKISKRTKTNFDDFIFEVISGIIKPIGFLLSFYFSIDYFFADEITFISVSVSYTHLTLPTNREV